jgi:hypothetical protein
LSGVSIGVLFGGQGYGSKGAGLRQSENRHGPVWNKTNLQMIDFLIYKKDIFRGVFRVVSRVFI